MQRRDFIKLSMVAGSAILLPTLTYSKKLNLDEIIFSSAVNSTNQAQTIIIYQYGGASQLCANLTNLAEIEPLSQSNYNYFGTITKTPNNCWAEAGGTHLETLLNNGDMSLFRSCFSHIRENTNNKAHGSCTVQNQKGSFDDDNAGLLTNLAQVLQAHGIIDENTIMPFITLEGESKFYAQGILPLDSFLKPVTLDENLENPYSRYSRDWRYYTEVESNIPNYNHEVTGTDALLHQKMDNLTKIYNQEGKIKDTFDKRISLDSFIQGLATASIPELGENTYPSENQFSDKIKTAVKILVNNPDTKVITVGTSGLGGWDDHNEAKEYVKRSESLFATLKSAMAHIKASGKEQQINIMVFGEFGRNVNLNKAQGWDHGNLQNFYVLGGKGYFNHKGIIGETIVESTGSSNRLYLKPKTGTYEFEPLSIAATLYKIYGIENPEILTNNNNAIDTLFT